MFSFLLHCRYGCSARTAFSRLILRSIVLSLPSTTIWLSRQHVFIIQFISQFIGVLVTVLSRSASHLHVIVQLFHVQVLAHGQLSPDAPASRRNAKRLNDCAEGRLSVAIDVQSPGCLGSKIVHVWALRSIFQLV